MSELRYDYDLQTWLRRKENSDVIWIVERCGHPKYVAGCFACDNAWKRIKKTLDN